MQNRILCLNGAFLPTREGVVPVADRGFRFGDGLFETIFLQAGTPYQWAFHLARLAQGLSALRITPPVVDWAAIARELIAKNAISDGFLRIAISRGSGSKGYLPTGDSPTWVMEILDLADLPAAPARLWLSSLPRIPPACLPVNQKLAHGINSTLAVLEARDQGCDEALQLTLSGALCEAASANLFWVSNGALHTPALATGCLNGSTRAAILRLAPVREVIADITALKTAEAVFITNCRLGIWPVAHIQPLGLNFNASHQAIAPLQAALAADRAVATWPAA
ncbi:MAG: aminotransferase class IV [Pseudomonadota bacterium]